MKQYVNLYIKITLLTLLVISSGGWIGDGLKGDCLFKYFWSADPCGFGKIIPSLAIAFAIFILSTWFLFIEGPKLFYRNIQSTPGVRPHRVLIMAVSVLNPAPQLKADGIYIYARNNEKFVKLSGKITDDIEAFSKEELCVNTQQLLRAVKPHLADNTLERVFLIGSEGEKGSCKLLEVVRTMLHLYNKDIEISIHGKTKDGIRFEDVEALRNEYEVLVQQAKEIKDKNYTENDIILDATGGQKTASIAAAMATFGHKELKFQYVETGGNNPTLTFNIVAGSTSRTT